MNTLAEKHLAKARNYLEKGDGFYHKAGAEMRAAKTAGATWTEVADALGRDESWVRRIVRWYETPANERAVPTPFMEPGREPTDVRGARRVLSEAPLEQVEQIIASLPKERQQALGAVAGNEYLKARQDYDESEKNLSISQRKEREASSEALTHSVRQAGSGFASMGIAGHIDQAREELRELVTDSSLTAEALRVVLVSDTAWREELQVAVAMVGLEHDLQEV